MVASVSKDQLAGELEKSSMVLFELVFVEAECAHVPDDGRAFRARERDIEIGGEKRGADAVPRIDGLDVNVGGSRLRGLIAFALYEVMQHADAKCGGAILENVEAKKVVGDVD